MQLMDVMDLLNAMNCKSSLAFFRHYLTIIERPLQTLALPGGPLASDDGVDDPQPVTSGASAD